MAWGLRIAGIGAAIGGLLCAIAIAIVVRAYLTVIHPRRGVFEAPRLGDDLEREIVVLRSADGTRLAAWFIRGFRRETVLLLHGYTACKDDMLSHAAFLHQAGFSVFLLDLRGCGDSALRPVTLGCKERDDVRAAVDYLLERDDVDHEGIGVLGLSLGASLAILAACDSPAVRAVVAEAAFGSVRAVIRRNFSAATHLPSFPWEMLTTRLAEWRQQVSLSSVMPEVEVAKLRRCGLLLIHALDDAVVAYADSEAIYARAPEPKEFWPIPSAQHAMAYLAVPQEYATRVVAHFNRWLGPLAGVADEPLNA